MKIRTFAYIMYASIATFALIGFGTVAKAASPSNQTATASSTFAMMPQVRKLIPSGAVITAEGKNKTSFVSMDLNFDGKTEYAVVYKYQPNKKLDPVPLAGTMIFNIKNGKVQKLWAKNGVVTPASMSVKDLLNNGKQEVIFKGVIGAMANSYEILQDSNGKIKLIFQTSAYRMNIGDYNKSGVDQLVTWTQTVGDIYNIQLYGWHKNTDRYTAISNNKAPNYFINTVIPYYNMLSKTKNGKEELKGIDYELANAYFDAGNYTQALTEINNGLKLTNQPYPPTSQFRSLKSQIERAK